jgi:ribosome-binding ATPase YchF (GTP1/OBG family)
VAQKACWSKLIAHFTEGKPARSLMKTWRDEKAVIKGFHLLTTKPVMYIANVAEDGFENNPHLDVVRPSPKKKAPWWCRCAPRSKPKSPSSMTAKRRTCSSADLGLEEPGLNRVIRAGYELLACRPTSPPA